MINDKIRDEKLQCDIKREATKISTFLSGKINHYEHHASGEILPYNQRQIIEHGKFVYSPLKKSSEKNPRKTGWYYKISRSF